MTAEVTPHHLLLTTDLLSGYDPTFKVNPPLRPAEDVEALRAALADGTIDAVATDHAPHARHDKEHAFVDAAFGMLGLETALPGGQRGDGRRRGCSTGPASPQVMSRPPGPDRRAGRPRPPAARSASRPTSPWSTRQARVTVDRDASLSLSRNNPWHGRTLRGAVHATVLRGRPDRPEGSAGMTRTESVLAARPARPGGLRPDVRRVAPSRAPVPLRRGRDTRPGRPAALRARRYDAVARGARAEGTYVSTTTVGLAARAGRRGRPGRARPRHHGRRAGRRPLGAPGRRRGARRPGAADRRGPRAGHGRQVGRPEPPGGGHLARRRRRRSSPPASCRASPRRPRSWSTPSSGTFPRSARRQPLDSSTARSHGTPAPTIRTETSERREHPLGPAHQQQSRLVEREPAVLVLEDGRTFRGESYGALGETVGEAVFSTGMTGYQETLTDPSYHRQVVVMTAPHVGNTGVNDEDDESRRIWVAGYVVRDPAIRPSSWRSRRSLEDDLAEQGVVGICGVDTRALTRHLRERGAMRVGLFSGALAAEPQDALLRAGPWPPPR